MSLSSSFTPSPDICEKARLLSEQARRDLQRGDRLGAVDLSRAALALDDNCFPAHCLLAEIALTGIDYFSMLENIHVHLQPRTYLEIGVARGMTISLAGANTLAIGIDPAPGIERPLPPNVRIVSETSDDFFARHDVKKEFDGNAIELGFIDGMHLFEYALRDFINIERNGARETKVLLHDCYPLDEVTAARERVTRFWTGDVWKLILCLKKYRPDLQIHTLAAPPTGMALIRGLDPDSTLLSSQLDSLCSEFRSLPYSTIQSEKEATLNLFPGDLDSLRALLA